MKTGDQITLECEGRRVEAVARAILRKKVSAPREIARAAIEAYEAALAEAGFVIVPKQPTKAMVDGYTIGNDDPHGGMLARHVWGLMLAADQDQR